MFPRWELPEFWVNSLICACPLYGVHYSLSDWTLEWGEAQRKSKKEAEAWADWTLKWRKGLRKSKKEAKARRIGR